MRGDALTAVAKTKNLSTTSSGEGIARASPRRASWILRAAERKRRMPYTPRTPHRPHERTSERRVARPGHARAKLGSDLQAARPPQAGVRGVRDVRGSEMSSGMRSGGSGMSSGARTGGT